MEDQNISMSGKTSKYLKILHLKLELHLNPIHFDMLCIVISYMIPEGLIIYEIATTRNSQHIQKSLSIYNILFRI